MKSLSALFATLTVATLFASPAWAEPNDEQVRALVAEILSSDFEAGRHRAAMNNLEAAKLACEGDGCSKQVLAELEIAAGIVQASGLVRHDEAVRSFKRALELDPKAAPPEGRMDDKVKAAFDEARGDSAGGSAGDSPEPEAAPPPRVAVYVEADDGEAEKMTREAVGPDFELVDSTTYAAEIKEGGLRGPMKFWVRSERLRERLLQAAKTANGKTDAEVVVLGIAEGTKIQLLIVDASGKVVHDETAGLGVDAISLAVSPTLRKLFPDLDDEPEEPEESDEPDEPDEPSEPFDGGDYGRAFIIGRLGFEMGSRSFSYVESEDNTDNLRDYDVTPVAGFGLDAEIYPGAMSDIPVVSDLGLEIGFGLAPSVHSSTEDGQGFSSSWVRFDIGGRARLRTGSGPWPVLGLSGSFGTMSYDFEPDDPAAEPVVEELPGVSYRWLRVGVDGRSQLDRVSVRLGAGYLGVLLGGDVYDRFRDPEPVAFELEGGAGVQIWQALEGVIDVTYTRLVYTFAPDVNDVYVASGSADNFVRARVGFAYAY